MTLTEAKRYLEGADRIMWQRLLLKVERAKRQREARVMRRLQAILDGERR